MVVDGNAIVKHKAVALPQAGLLWRVFEVVQNAAFKVVNLLKPLPQQVGGGLFAANAAGAKHRDFFVLGWVEMGGYVVGEFSKGVGMGIYRALKGTQLHLKIVAGIDDNHLRIGNDLIPVLGIDVGADLLVGGPGGDTLYGGPGADKVDARDGRRDVVDLTGSGSGDVVYYDKGIDEFVRASVGPVEEAARTTGAELTAAKPPEALFAHTGKVLVEHEGGGLLVAEKRLEAHTGHGDEILDPTGRAGTEQGR